MGPKRGPQGPNLPQKSQKRNQAEHNGPSEWLQRGAGERRRGEFERQVSDEWRPLAKKSMGGSTSGSTPTEAVACLSRG